MSVDESVLKKLPQVECILDFSVHGASPWASTFRIDTQHRDGHEHSYFLKISTGYHGRESLKGEYESTFAMRAIVPEFVPNPIGWGTYKSQPDTHFYLAEFRTLGEEPPEPPEFCRRLAKLHKNGTSPTGKFGFHVVTYNGDLPQDNTFADTWEGFFANGFKHMLNLNLERAGKSEQLDALTPAFFEKVIPRLLRPLETGGNSIAPALVHGDLWCGNAAMDLEDDMPIVFDRCCFWAHNEYELGNWRPERNKFPQSFFSAYHSHITKAYPKEDYDDRNALYALRFNLHAATLFPDNSSFRESVIDDMQRLVAKYPDGYEGYAGQKLNMAVETVELPMAAMKLAPTPLCT